MTSRQKKSRGFLSGASLRVTPLTLVIVVGILAIGAVAILGVLPSSTISLLKGQVAGDTTVIQTVTLTINGSLGPVVVHTTVPNGSVKLAWSATNAHRCKLSGRNGVISSGLLPSGTLGLPQGDGTYAMACTNDQSPPFRYGPTARILVVVTGLNQVARLQAANEAAKSGVNPASGPVPGEAASSAVPASTIAAPTPSSSTPTLAEVCATGSYSQLAYCRAYQGILLGAGGNSTQCPEAMAPRPLACGRQAIRQALGEAVTNSPYECLYSCHPQKTSGCSAGLVQSSVNCKETSSGGSACEIACVKPEVARGLYDPSSDSSANEIVSDTSSYAVPGAAQEVRELPGAASSGTNEVLPSTIVMPPLVPTPMPATWWNPTTWPAFAEQEEAEITPTPTPTTLPDTILGNVGIAPADSNAGAAVNSADPLVAVGAPDQTVAAADQSSEADNELGQRVWRTTTSVFRSVRDFFQSSIQRLRTRVRPNTSIAP